MGKIKGTDVKKGRKEKEFFPVLGVRMRSNNERKQYGI